MRNKSKYILLLPALLIAVIVGCESKGIQGLIYHDKELIAKTVCNDDLFVRIMPDTVIVRSKYRSSYGLYDKEVYMYLNDGKYRIERKECVR